MIINLRRKIALIAVATISAILVTTLVIVVITIPSNQDSRKAIILGSANDFDDYPDSDGFPAQALQVYWVLKRHGYNDDNIFLMLYHTNDLVVDIFAYDGIANDLTGAVIDVENDDVNASRFKRELNVSISGSFSSKIKPKDQLIIFMADHGKLSTTDGNVSIVFESDNSTISELEFYDLVREIDSQRMMINADFCYSGNFLNPNENFGQTWYDLPNCLFISSSANTLSYYWADNSNLDGWIGSFFFHTFWDFLDQSLTIGAAFNLSLEFIPFAYTDSVEVIQNPLMKDNLGIKDTWGFSGTPRL